jgi:inosine-uridine nucleoside N-ribohydrolase
MRPRNLAEYVGQTHILAPGQLLRRAIDADDLVAKIGDFYVTRAEKNGFPGGAMYDPLAVVTGGGGSLVKLQDMHVDVETRGEFTRGETTANRIGGNEKYVLNGDHYEILTPAADAMMGSANAIVASHLRGERQSMRVSSKIVFVCGQGDNRARLL